MEHVAGKSLQPDTLFEIPSRGRGSIDEGCGEGGGGGEIVFGGSSVGELGRDVGRVFGGDYGWGGGGGRGRAGGDGLKAYQNGIKGSHGGWARHRTEPLERVSEGHYSGETWHKHDRHK